MRTADILELVSVEKLWTFYFISCSSNNLSVTNGLKASSSELQPS